MTACSSKTKKGRKCKAPAIGRTRKCLFHSSKGKKTPSKKKTYRRR